MKNTLYGGILCLLFLMTSCKKKTYPYSSHGVVRNKVTGEPISGAVVSLKDGLVNNDPYFGDGSGPEEMHYDTTGEDGKYLVHVQTTSGHSVIRTWKKGYRFDDEDYRNDNGYIYVSEGFQEKDLMLEGLRPFNPPFVRNSSSASSKDSLLISILTYENLSIGHITWSGRKYSGEGSFFLTDNPFTVPSFLGDRYLRYKLEWTDSCVWKSKIDSVFLPTSLEVYTDTIFY